MTGLPERPPVPSGRWQGIFAETVRLVIAPLILLSSGFFTADFIASGQFTWPRTSRVFVLTVTVLILGYEFVYKEQLARSASQDRALSSVLYSCVLPYVIGALVVIALARL